jgi:hypothetical protein
MSSTITALTSGGGIALAGDTSGVLDLKSGNGTYTATLPAATGTVMVSGNQPAFSAWLSNQSITQNTNTTMSFNNEFFDTNSCFNNTGSTVGGIPAYAFLPNVAGYYQVSMSSLWTSYGGNNYVSIALFKNNSGVTEYSRINFASGTTGGSSLIYLNGTTDYITAVWYSSNGNCTLVASNGSFFSNFSASLVRAA